MSRPTDMILIRAEVACLNDEARKTLMHAAQTTIAEELANQIKRWRGLAYETRLSDERVRSGACRCELCAFGRRLDAVGLL